MKKEIKIGILGCGTMGSSILDRILRKRIFRRKEVLINDKDKEKEERMFRKYRVQVLEINEFLRESDFIILAIKPQDFLPFAKEVNFPKDKILISIMAGVGTSSIKKMLGIKKIVRAMPNLMARIGKGVIVWKVQGLSSNEIRIVRKIFNALGKEIRVEDESLIDQATLISGCGPGYLYFFEDLLLNSFGRLGFSREFTLKLLLNAFFGAILYQKEEKSDLRDLIEMVASKGGVTEKFLRTLKEKNIYNIFYQAAKKAYKRNKELKI